MLLCCIFGTTEIEETANLGKVVTRVLELNVGQISISLRLLTELVRGEFAP